MLMNEWVHEWVEMTLPQMLLLDVVAEATGA